NGTATCTGSTGGTFVTSSDTSILATNVANQINACNSGNSAVGVTASPSTNTVTVTETKPGAFLGVGGSNLGSIYSWGAISGNSPGSATCPSSTTGTFATSGNTTTLAVNIRDAINACNTAFPAVGASASASTNTVTVTDTTPGGFTTFSVA